MRRVVIAPDKFKGSLTAREAARAISRGLASVWTSGIELVEIPMADGGDGTVDAFVDAGAARVVCRVRGPLGSLVDSAFALDGATAIVESAAAAGLVLLRDAERDPMRTTTYGVGELIRAALDAGARRIVVGLGGSATNDGGAGMLEALGVRLLDGDGHDLGSGGASLASLATIDATGIDPRLRDVRIEAATDVDNPLCGPWGASVVFGPQKGARARDVARLDAALGHFADLAARATGRDRRDAPGAGAAGGLGFALMAFLGAVVRPGVEVVAELRGLGKALDGAWLCVTGEGRIDEPTLHGKTVAGVARLCVHRGVRAIALTGAVVPEAEAALAKIGVTSLPIADRPMPIGDALRAADALLERAARRVALLIDIGTA